MKYLVALVVSLSVTSTVSAKDVMIILNETEAQALVQLLDEAVKAKGIVLANNAAVFYEKLKAAPEVKAQTEDQPK
jgi:hypothetical protein